ncbi:MAG TPA: hypothetical protein VLH77_07345 [Gammaproteobacteria bacterium]|nr:hypothetical protein [Gammaproteobacteria bacterium]
MTKIKLLAGLTAAILVLLIAKLSIAETDYKNMEIQPVADPQVVTTIVLPIEENA